jgi:hypothetical protein
MTGPAQWHGAMDGRLTFVFVVRCVARLPSFVRAFFFFFSFFLFSF